jgi:hypothetical protein
MLESVLAPVNIHLYNLFTDSLLISALTHGPDH